MDSLDVNYDLTFFGRMITYVTLATEKVHIGGFDVKADLKLR